LIGLTGYAGAGKDTVATYLYGYGYARYAFADKLKEEVYEAFPDIRETVDEVGWDKAKWVNPHVRTTLQDYGVWRRTTEGAYYWVNRVIEQLNADRPPFVVITDVRFPNEAAYVRSICLSDGGGGALVKVERDGVGPVNDHVSESLDVAPTFWV